MSAPEIAHNIVKLGIIDGCSSASVVRVIRRSIENAEGLFKEEPQGQYSVFPEEASTFLEENRWSPENCVAGIHWPSEKVSRVPEKRGMYILYAERAGKRVCTYIGQAGQSEQEGNLRQRLVGHGKEFTHFSFVVVSQDHIRLLEQFLIASFTAQGSDNKMDVSLTNTNLTRGDTRAFLGSRSAFRSVEIR